MHGFPEVIGGFCVPYFYCALYNSLIINEFNILHREIEPIPAKKGAGNPLGLSAPSQQR